MKEEKGHHKKIYKQIVGCWKEKNNQVNSRIIINILTYGRLTSHKKIFRFGE